MDQALADMLVNTVRSAREMHAAAEALGTSFIALMPFQVGQVLEYGAGVTFKVERVTFEMGAYMRGGKFEPGFAAMGRQMIGHSIGSTSRRLVFDLQGQRVTFGASS